MFFDVIDWSEDQRALPLRGGCGRGPFPLPASGDFGRHSAQKKRKSRLGDAGLSFGKRGIGDHALHGEV
jgi:hypothetical protein